MLHADLQVQAEVSTLCQGVLSQASLAASCLPPADAQPATCYELLCTFMPRCKCPCAHPPAPCPPSVSSVQCDSVQRPASSNGEDAQAEGTGKEAQHHPEPHQCLSLLAYTTDQRC